MSSQNETISGNPQFHSALFSENNTNPDLCLVLPTDHNSNPDPSEILAAEINLRNRRHLECEHIRLALLSMSDAERRNPLADLDPYLQRIPQPTFVSGRPIEQPAHWRLQTSNPMQRRLQTSKPTHAERMESVLSIIDASLAKRNKQRRAIQSAFYWRLAKIAAAFLAILVLYAALFH